MIVLLALAVIGLLFVVDRLLSLARFSEPLLYRPHVRLGWTLTPNSTREVVLLHKGQVVMRNVLAINSEGFNSCPLEEFKNPSTKRVLIVGDSMVESRHVPSDANLASHCERYLKRKAGPEWEVHNIGVAGWSADNALDFIRVFGKRYAPDVVLFSLFLGNDLVEADYQACRFLFRFASDCRRFDKPCWTYTGGELRVTNDPAWSNFVSNLLSVHFCEASWSFRHIFRLWNKAMEHWFNGNLRLKKKGLSYNDFMNQRLGLGHYVELLLSLLDRLQLECHQAGSHFGVVLLPNATLLLPPPEVHGSSKKKREYDLDEKTYRLFCDMMRTRFPVLETLAPLREDQKEGRNMTLWPYDLHFGLDGHERMGALIGEFILARLVSSDEIRTQPPA